MPGLLARIADVLPTAPALAAMKAAAAGVTPAAADVALLVVWLFGALLVTFLVVTRQRMVSVRRLAALGR